MAPQAHRAGLGRHIERVVRDGNASTTYTDGNTDQAGCQLDNCLSPVLPDELYFGYRTSNLTIDEALFYTSGNP